MESFVTGLLLIDSNSEIRIGPRYIHTSVFLLKVLGMYYVSSYGRLSHFIHIYLLCSFVLFYPYHLFFSNCACMIQFLVLLQTTKHPKLMFYCIYPVVMLFSGLHPMGPGFSSVMVLPGFVGQHHGDSEMGLMTWYAGVKFLCILWKNYALILLIDSFNMCTSF